jgi:4-diphosphocytidyl-2-C-methyl-D-erythritol kinase
MKRAKAYAKINLGLVVGPVRPDGKHEIATVLQRVDLQDDVALERRENGVVVEGFPEDTLARAALATLAEASGTASGWRVQIEKRIPVAAGLGGGSSDAAAVLELANRLLPTPLSSSVLRTMAARIGSDVPFFLAEGAQLGSGDGSELTPIAIPLDFTVLLLVPDGEQKASTADVYRRFDEGRGADGFETRRAALREAVEHLVDPRDLAALPRNDLASSPLAAKLESLGAFRADVSGAGPAVYALFVDAADAIGAASAMREAGRTWLTRPLAAR